MRFDSYKLRLLILILAGLVFVVGCFLFFAQNRDKNPNIPQESFFDGPDPCPQSIHASLDEPACLAWLFHRARLFEKSDSNRLRISDDFEKAFGTRPERANISLDRINGGYGVLYAEHVFSPAYKLSNDSVIYLIDQYSQFATEKFTRVASCSMRNVVTAEEARSAIQDIARENVDIKEILLGGRWGVPWTDYTNEVIEPGNSVWTIIERNLVARFGDHFSDGSIGSRNIVIDSLKDNVLREPEQYSGDGSILTPDLIPPKRVFFASRMLGENIDCFWTARTENGREFLIDRNGKVMEVLSATSLPGK